jgi:LCP family protein required for cell wall assembly
MNDFQRRQIRKGLSPSEKKEQKAHQEREREHKKSAPREHMGLSQLLINAFQKHYVWGTILVLVVVIMGKMTWNVATLAEEFTVKEIVLSAFSEKVETDLNNHTNVLLLGTGTADHDGADLTDTILVASIDHDNDLVSMLSIPRDYYSDVPEIFGGNRINSILALVAEQEIYNKGLSPAEEKKAFDVSYDILMREVGEVVNMDIHYYGRVDFNGFIDVVDAIGGIDVMVDEDIYDPFYPAENGVNDFSPFAIQAGQQHLDGDTALRFVRSRKTTSDFDRAARQQKVLQALKDKALSAGLLGNPSKLKNLYGAFQDNFETNLEWDQIAYLAKISEKFDRGNVNSWVLNDNPLTEGGFLYTPDRNLYQGAFVLIPYIQDGTDVHRFAELVLSNQEAHKDPLTYQILNGTGANGLATETMYYMGRFGFDVVRYGNAAEVPIPKTRFIPRGALLEGQLPEDAVAQPQLEYLQKHIIPVGEIVSELPPEYAPIEWETQADVIIELGQDYVNWMEANAKFFY